VKLLMIEDDKNLLDAVSEQIRTAGYDIDVCMDGTEAEFYLERSAYDLILLDRMLPGTDGMTLLKNYRKRDSKTPILMVTALNGLNDRIDGLDCGADDYVVKPFEMEELLARIRALIRRSTQVEETNKIVFSDLCFIASEKLLWRDEKSKSIRLSKREGALLEYMILNAKQVVTREQIMDRVWGNNSFVEDGNIDNYIHILRKRLKQIGSGVTIKTVYGIGYQIQPGRSLQNL